MCCYGGAGREARPRAWPSLTQSHRQCLGWEEGGLLCRGCPAPGLTLCLRPLPSSVGHSLSRTGWHTGEHTRGDREMC